MDFFPWMCCSVCTDSSQGFSSLFITELCGHFVCDNCKAKCKVFWMINEAFNRSMSVASVVDVALYFLSPGYLSKGRGFRAVAETCK